MKTAAMRQPWALWLMATFLSFCAAVDEPLKVKSPMTGFQDSDRTSGYPTRLNAFCEREIAVRNGSVPLRDALKGMKISFLVLRDVKAQLWTQTDAEDNVVGGYHITLMEEVAKRAGFTWQESFALSDGPLPAETYTDWAIYHLKTFDVVVDWFVDVSSRRAKGLTYPRNFLDLSLILYTRVVKVEPSLYDQLFSWLRPFHEDLWYAIEAAILFSAAVYWYLEKDAQREDLRSSGRIDGLTKGAFYASANFTGAGGFAPVTPLGRVYTLSWTFCTLLIVSAYTANLATFLIVKSEAKPIVASIQDASASDATICVLQGSALVTATRTYAAANGIKINLLEKHGDDIMPAVRSGECAAAVETVDTWSLAEIGAENAECDMKYVGRPFKSGSGGWVTRSNAKNFGPETCRSVLNDVISLHMTEMEDEEFFLKAWNRVLDSQRQNNCNVVTEAVADPDEGRQTLKKMGGLFLVHSIISFLCIIAHSYRKHRRRGKTADEASGGGGGGKDGSSESTPEPVDAVQAKLADTIERVTLNHKMTLAMLLDMQREVSDLKASRGGAFDTARAGTDLGRSQARRLSNGVSSAVRRFSDSISGKPADYDHVPDGTFQDLDTFTGETRCASNPYSQQSNEPPLAGISYWQKDQGEVEGVKEV